MTTLSIIVPSFNRPIDELLSGLADNRVEAILIDDGSNPPLRRPSLSIPTQLIRQLNQGPGMSKNAGLEAAHGDYVWFVDSDDRIQPAPVLSRLDEFTEDMIVFGAWQDGDMFEQFENYGLVPSKLYRRSFLIENDIRFSESYSSEDNFFALQTSELHQTRRVISEQIYEVVLTPNSISRGPFNPKFVTRWKAVGDILDFARKHPREGLEKLERYCIFLSLGLTWSYYLERGRVRELLWSMPKFVSKLSEWGLLDQISVFLSSGSRKNRLLKRTAYLLSGGWRSVGSGRSLSG